MNWFSGKEEKYYHCGRSQENINLGWATVVEELKSPLGDVFNKLGLG